MTAENAIKKVFELNAKAALRNEEPSEIMDLATRLARAMKLSMEYALFTNDEWEEIDGCFKDLG